MSHQFAPAPSAAERPDARPTATCAGESTERLLEVLRSVEFLSDGPYDLAPQFMAFGRSRDLPAGHLFWRPGQTPQGIVIPVSGELAEMKSDIGGRRLCYGFFGAGECAGAPCAADGLPHVTEARAFRAGEFFVMERAAFLLFLSGRPAVLASVLASVGRLFRRSLEERDRVVFLPVHVRVARVLLEHACVRKADDGRLLLRMTHTDLAGRVASVREVVARAMAAFAEQGIIRRTPHGMFIADRVRLRAIAGLGPRDGTDSASDSVEAASRTRRFFLPVLQHGPESIAREARVCGDQLASLAVCLASGCPLAVAVRRGADTVRPGADAAESRGDPDRGPAARLSAGSTGTRGRDAASPPAHAADRDAAPGASDRTRRFAGSASTKVLTGGASRRRTVDYTVARSPWEDRAVKRRVGVYRRRASRIESTFVSEASIPASASVFLPSEPASY
jgi:CRP/FNR family transcriptional regulator, cyclic AMP receptor protein